MSDIMKPLFQLLLILCPLHCMTQDVWININETTGLMDNRVKSIAFDSSNNVWFGMGSGSFGYGIDKFDGTSFIHYDTDNSQIPSNAIKEIKIDQNDNLWFSFYGGLPGSIRKLTKFDGINWTVFDTENSNISSDGINHIQIDIDNNVWTSSIEGFSKYDGENFTNYQLDVYPSRFIVENSTSIWFSYRLNTLGPLQGLAHYNTITGETDLFNQDNSNLPSYSISAIEMDSSGVIILGFSFAFEFGGQISNGGIAMFDGIEFEAMMPFSSLGTGVYDLKVDYENNLWVSTRCEGLYKYDWNNWSNIAGPPLNGCSFEIEQDLMGHMWFGEVSTGAWTNNDGALNTTEIEPFNIQVYPNPASHYFNVSHYGIADLNFNLYSSIGNLIKQQSLNSAVSENQISISNYSAGMYFWTVEHKGKVVKTGKIMML